MSINKMIWTCSFAVLLASCSTQKTNEWFVSHNGNMPTNERIDKIKVGTSKEEVKEILGAPSVVVSFDSNTWIYMSSDVKRVAFFAPEEVNRDVLTLKFDEKDNIKEIKRLSKADGKDIKPVSDYTPSYGQNMGFFRKYFGGVGQYNPFGGVNSSRM